MGLSWQMFRRDVRHNSVLFVALLLAVAALSSVFLATQRLQSGLQQKAASLIAADVLLRADEPIRAELLQRAQQLQLRTARTVQFPSMLLVGERSMLVSAKAVEAGYPLRGELTLDAGQGARTLQAVPAPGTVWLDPQIMRRMQLKPGAEIQLGEARFRVAASLQQEPDATLSFAALAPRLMFNWADLPGTGLIQPESRVSYRLLLAGEPAALARWVVASKPGLQRGESIEQIKDARPEMQDMLERAGYFLTLAALLSSVLTVATAWLASQRYVQRHLLNWALMKSMGERSSRLFRLYLLQFLWLGGLASALGVLLGWLGQAALVTMLGKLVMQDLPPPSLLPLLGAFLFGLLLMLAFVLPPLWSLRKIPAWQVLRQGEVRLPPWSTALLLGGLLLALVAWVLTRNVLAGGIMLATVLVLGLLAAGLCLLWLRLLRRMAARWPLPVRLGLSNLWRQPGLTSLKVASLMLGLTALLLIAVTGRDVLQYWQRQLPAGTPNRFVINLQEDQMPQFRQVFREAGLPEPVSYPMIRGRLLSIAGREVKPELYPDPQTQRLARREFNLSWGTALPADNRLIQGQPWGPGSRDGWSVEEGIARQLGIRLGDELRYEVAGQVVSGKVQQIRALDWGSFRVNFFVTATPDLLQQHAGNRISSFYLAPQQAALGDRLVQRMPNISLIDVTAALDQVQQIVTQLGRVVSFVLMFSILSGLTVLAASVQGSLPDRLRDAAVLRVLGMPKRALRLALVAEFSMLGALAGMLATAGAEGGAMLLARYVLEIPYQGHPMLWAGGMLGGALVVWLLVWPAARRVSRQTPMQVLREA